MSATRRQSRSILARSGSIFCLNKQELVTPSRESCAHLWIISCTNIFSAAVLCKGHDSSSGGTCAHQRWPRRWAVPENRSLIHLSREARASLRVSKSRRRDCRGPKEDQRVATPWAAARAVPTGEVRTQPGGLPCSQVAIQIGREGR